MKPPLTSQPNALSTRNRPRGSITTPSSAIWQHYRRATTMPGKLDAISHAIGSLETSVRELQRQIAENRELQLRRHEDNSAALRDLATKIDLHAASVEMIRPTVAALELSRSKLATWATLGLTVAIVAGWFVEAFFKWLFERIL